MRVALLLALCVSLCAADVYLHSPPGSNNRNRERKENRNNANRLFDSQNNGKGGYPWRGDPRGKGVGDPLTYYVGSKLQIEWTNQNGCGGNPNVHCELIIQYACDDTLPGLRDGYPNGNQCFDSSKDNQDTPVECNGNYTWIGRKFRRSSIGTSQIPSPFDSLQRHLSPDELNSKYINGSDDFIEYGLHENHLHYMECLRTMRNHGLYLADQSLGGNTARFTRQNPRGNRRHGLECPEERDYYPYWRKQPWKDIAILVSNTSFCEFFQTQSQNVRTYGRCQCPDSENECPFLETVCTSRNYTWVTDPSHGLKAPDCLYHPFTRDNHLGNSYEVDLSTGDLITPTPGSKPVNPHYKLTIPQDMAGKMCVIRLRYNISTNDYPSHAYADKSNAQCNYKERDGVRYDDPSCGRGTGVKADQNCPFVIGQTVCPLPDGANAVGNPDCDSTVDAYTSPPECYPLITEFTASSVPRSNRPFINLFDRDISAGAAFKLGFAVNTHQTARTFQDRSYVFRVAEAPVNASITNLGFRGRRGNIVQAYPAVEYDFVPSVLRCAEGDYIHIQFHGSDFNTARNQNNAEGWQYSDRTNIVRINSSSVNYPVYQEGIDFFNETEAVFFGWGGQDPTYCDRSIEDDDSKQNQFTNCGKLNMMPNRFPQDPAKGLKQCNARPGSYYHMSTRNNNFSNRVQKVLIIVQGPDTTAPTSSPVTLTPTSGSSASGNKKNDGLSTNAEIGISFATIIFIGFAAVAVTLYVKKKELWCFKKTIPEQPSVVSLQNFHPDGELGETINPPIST